MLALANIPDKDGLANKPHAKPRTVAFDHAVKTAGHRKQSRTANPSLDVKKSHDAVPSAT